MTSHKLPLCVDCDGTLTPTDLLYESVLLLIKQAPVAALSLPFWLTLGKATFKARVAERVRFDWSTIPLNREVVARIQQARSEGRRVILATASHRTLAEPFAAHVDLFDGVLCTENETNMSGVTKARQLVQQFGERGFDYVANARSDLPVWSASRLAVVVSGSRRLRTDAARRAASMEVVDVPRAPLAAYLKALRIHQWLKNLLVFAPVVAAHRLFSLPDITSALLAFASFGLCASAVYVINDLLDLEADRRHVRKRMRPFASGAIPLLHGVALLPVLLGSSALLASYLPAAFGAVLLAYFGSTLAYSIRLKRQVVVDVLMLAGLYTVRVIAGGAAVAIVPSFWLLALSMFMFLSLALVKRYSELRLTLQQDAKVAAGRGYTVNDLPVLLSLGVSSAMVAVLVFALYIHDPETGGNYPAPFWLWAVPPLLLYWVSRMWMKVHRGEVDDDPVVFAARDWQSLVAVGLAAACFMLAARG